MLTGLKIVPYLARTRDRWLLQWKTRAVEADWQEIVDQMTPVQKMVHLAGRHTGADERDMAQRLFNEGRETYRQTLQDELNRWGCVGQKALVPSFGAELSAIRERADWAAEGIRHTYNRDLAREIVEIGKDTPTANRNTYAYRLFYQANSWDGQHWEWKGAQIAETETMAMVNAGVADFYARNGDVIQAEANVQPFSAQCPYCQEMVGGNPYQSVDEIYRLYEIPPHPHCPHHGSAVANKRLSSEECRMLWAGG